MTILFLYTAHIYIIYKYYKYNFLGYNNHRLANDQNYRKVSLWKQNEKIVQQKEHSTENYPSLLITNIVSNLYKKINVIL